MNKEKRYDRLSWMSLLASILVVGCGIYMFSMKIYALSLTSVAFGFGLTEIGKHYDRKYRNLKKEHQSVDEDNYLDKPFHYSEFDHE